MYQIPVGDLGKLRNSRKRVKSILCDIGLQDCEELIEKLKSFDAGDESFDNTEWDDFTEGHKRRKWEYRTDMLCCNLCWYSTHSWYSFRGHLHRIHEEELDLAKLSACSSCVFIGPPEVTDRHVKLFHGPLSKTPPAYSQASVAQTSKVLSVSSNPTGDRYSCRSCGYHDSLIYVMKKHVLVNHYASLLDRYFGHKTDRVKIVDGAKTSRYFCKMCSLPAETTEHLLYHILSSEKHKELHLHINPFICENGGKLNRNAWPKLQSLAPKVAQQVFSQAPMVKGASCLQPGLQPNRNPITSIPSRGTVLLAAPSNTTALLCSPGARQVFLPGNAMATLQNTQQPSVGMRPGLPSSTVLKASVSMLMSQNGPKQVPITVTVPRLPQGQPGQVLLPPRVQINVPGKIGLRGPQPLLVTQRLPLSPSAPRPPIITSQSVRLIPTGNKVNGVPTYTLAPVQVTVPVQSSAAQMVNKGSMVLTQSNATAAPQSNVTAAPQNKAPAGAPPNSTTVSIQAASANVKTLVVRSAQKQALTKNSKANELAVQAPFLKRLDNKTVKCLTCKILIAEKGIFQHLLHGLKCLFCPMMFYSFKQIMEHTNKDHSLLNKDNRDFIKREFQLNTNDQGNLVFTKFDLNTNVPKDLLGYKEMNLALVTGSQDKIYIKMYPESAKPMWSTPVRSMCTDCPFCQDKPQTLGEYELHLKTKHHIVSTIHAILKSPAFKCIYCLGVYTDKSTSKTISIHVQRCRCAPKAAKDAERLLHPDPNGQVNGGENMETAAKEGVDAAPQRSDVPLLLDPTGMETHSFQDRKEFLSKYFHQKPYLSKVEMETLASRLWINRPDVSSLFAAKRSRCMKAIQRKKTVVLLGFNMAAVKKVKHNLLIPEVLPAKVDV